MRPLRAVLLLSLVGGATVALAAQDGPVQDVAQAPVPQTTVPGSASVPSAARMTPYIFSTLGKAHDSVIHIAETPGQGVAVGSSQTSVQFGAGMQFNELLGAEGFVQGGQRHGYQTVGGARVTQSARVFGARVTLGVDLTEHLRIFGKAGLARVIHSGRGTWNAAIEGQDYSNRQSRSMLGLGATVRLTGRLTLRADADHVFKRRNDKDTGWGHLNHFGLGLQYSY